MELFIYLLLMFLVNFAADASLISDESATKLINYFLFILFINSVADPFIPSLISDESAMKSVRGLSVAKQSLIRH